MPGHEHGMSIDEARRRLNALRDKEKRGELTVHDAGEITRLLVILGEHETGGRKGGERAA